MEAKSILLFRRLGQQLRHTAQVKGVDVPTRTLMGGSCYRGRQSQNASNGCSPRFVAVAELIHSSLVVDQTLHRARSAEPNLVKNQANALGAPEGHPGAGPSHSLLIGGPQPLGTYAKAHLHAVDRWYTGTSVG